MKIYNMTSSRGNKVPNQFIIESDDFKTFQSYNSTVARYFWNGHVELDKNWDYSRTTNKYLYKFLNCNRKEIMDKLKSGEYTISDLNLTK